MNMPLFPSSKSVNRFEMTSRYPYLSDNEVTPTRYSSGYKLHEIGDTDKVLNNSFKELHNPDQNLGIDEQIIGKARISFLQHMLRNSKKFGIKVCLLCEYLSGLKFQVYNGKTENEVEHGQNYRAVSDLLKSYKNKNHHVYFDNFR